MAIAPSPTYSLTKQEFLNSVLNKIGKQEYSDQVYVNPLARLKGGFIDNASDIEEIYVSKASSGNYDPSGSGVLDRVKPNVSVQYHTNEIEHAYKVSVHDKQMRKGFLTKGAVSKMGDHILQSMHTSANLDEFTDCINTIKALCGAKKTSNTFALDPVTNETSAKAFCKQVKKVIPKMGQWNSDFSAKENFAKPSNLMLFIDSDVDVEIDTEYLAGLFNMTKGELNNTTKVVIPNFKTLMGGKDFALLCDSRCLKIHPTYYNIESIRNTKGKFTNYDLVTNLLLSYTDWFQFAVFTEKTTT